MLRYLTHFSCLLDVRSRANITTAREIYHRLGAQSEQDAVGPVGFLLSEWPEGEGATLWMQNDDDGNPENVVRFVLRCASAFSLTGQWGFAWSRTCSQARVGAFGGGAHVVDLGEGRTVAWIDTEVWLARNLDNFQPGASDPRIATH